MANNYCKNIYLAHIPYDYVVRGPLPSTFPYQVAKARKVNQANDLLEKATQDKRVQRVIGKKPAGRGRGRGGRGGRGKQSQVKSHDDEGGEETGAPMETEEMKDDKGCEDSKDDEGSKETKDDEDKPTGNATLAEHWADVDSWMHQFYGSRCVYLSAHQKFD